MVRAQKRGIVRGESAQERPHPRQADTLGTACRWKP